MLLLPWVNAGIEVRLFHAANVKVRVWKNEAGDFQGIAICVDLDQSRGKKGVDEPFEGREQETPTLILWNPSKSDYYMRPDPCSTICIW